jgi:hypothetical protein
MKRGCAGASTESFDICCTSAATDISVFKIIFYGDTPYVASNKTKTLDFILLRDDGTRVTFQNVVFL